MCSHIDVVLFGFCDVNFTLRGQREKIAAPASKHVNQHTAHCTSEAQTYQQHIYVGSLDRHPFFCRASYIGFAYLIHTHIPREREIQTRTRTHTTPTKFITSPHSRRGVCLSERACGIRNGDDKVRAIVRHSTRENSGPVSAHIKPFSSARRRRRFGSADEAGADWAVRSHF